MTWRSDMTYSRPTRSRAVKSSRLPSWVSHWYIMKAMGMVKSKEMRRNFSG